MRSNTAVIRVGCLLEIRADAGYRTHADVDQLFDILEAEVARMPPPYRHVTVVDWRNCPVMAPAAAERIVQRIIATNVHTVRSAALARADAPVAVLQFVRLIREAGMEDRKLFFDADELANWLAELLNPAETKRLRDFLSESTAAMSIVAPSR